VSIRFQLLIVALTTLILPWAGCRYARELETALRVSQENALEASADTIAHALSAEPSKVFRDPADAVPFAADQGDLYVFPLHAQPLLDGYREDWDVAADPQWLLPSRSASPAEPSSPESAPPQSAVPPSPPGKDDLAARMQAGSTDRYLFLYVEADDAHYRAEPRDPHPDRDRFDRVNLTIEESDGTLGNYLFATGAPGLIEAESIASTDGGEPRLIAEPRIQAFWLETAHGFHMEARIPLGLVGPRFRLEVEDGSGRKAASAPVARRGRLFMTTPGLSELLATFIPAGTRASVIDANRLKLAVAGSLESAPTGEDAENDSWYRTFLTVDTSSWPLETSLPDRITGASVTAALAGQPAADWLRAGGNQNLKLLAAAPIRVDGEVRGAVVLEQAGDQLLDLRDRALTRLFNLTLLATALAVLFAFSVAGFISVRIGRLRTAAEAAVGNDGRIALEMPESSSADEIGALARGFERLLTRLNEHTQYLRTLGGKLAHELRTPLTIVRSSLDNLESEGIRADQRGYVTRAREGVARLQSILSALGAAARVEESIKQAERVRFDLKTLLDSAVASYRDAFPRVRFELETPPDECNLRGAPDLVAQMLDKLIENAVDFCPDGGHIYVRLVRSGSHYELSVSNDGPPIPDGMLERLFESLFEHREGHDDKPHFGLGLYIVRLIAEFHDGKAVAANRPDGAGAVFSVVLPLI
jgi:two-component system, OmpR family, sensor histidine kinase ChvG